MKKYLFVVMSVTVLLFLASLTIGVDNQRKDWQMFGYDACHSGCYTVLENTTAVYITDKDVLYCIDYKDGHIIWAKQKLGDLSGSLPLVSGDKVYIGSKDSAIYCLNASTGSVLWSYKTNGDTRYSYIITDRLFVQDASGSFFCINGETGELMWERTTFRTILGMPEAMRIPPVSMGEKVYTGGLNISCFDVETGNPIWTSAVGGVFSLAIVEDRLITLSGTGIFCFDANNGTKMWDTKLAQSPYLSNSNITIYNGNAYFHLTNSHLYCVNTENGEIEWSKKLPTMAFSSPAIKNDKLFVGCADGNLYCFNATNGELIWKYLTGGSISSPIVIEDRVIFSSSDRHIYCVDADECSTLWYFQKY